MTVRAVFFDFGGVITTSPFEAFARFEERSGLPAGLIRRLNSSEPDTNAWAALERGEIDLETFVVRFEAEAAATGSHLNARAVLSAVRGELRPAVVTAVKRCSARLTTALLTNNFLTANTTGEPDSLLRCFDVIVESSLAGCRKPELRFYELACELASVDPHDVVFLDDLGINLKPARAMGMHTIKVTDPDEALAELEAAVGFGLA